ncbi:hypothetical protein AB0D30_08100 [Streptomyces sp. NPDC048409]|uniref:hypothetical protein n=1 Tax=Streptomyces TaxID=1883 RepID=UPI0033300232
MRPRTAAAAVALLAALCVGCGHGGGGSAQQAPATPSGYSEMQQKVAAAESAVAQADKDAAQDDTGR